MPIYAYRCQACGFAKDALQKISDAPLVDCPECGQPALVKQVTAAGFQLKGSGWYVTDFRDGGQAKAKDPAAKAGDAAPGSDAAAAADASAAKADATAAKPDAAASSSPPPASPAPSPSSASAGGGAPSPSGS